MDSAEQASIDEIQNGLPVFEHNGFRRPDIEVKFGLDNEFRCEPLNSACQDHKNQIVSIAKDGENWRLLLRNRYDAEVVLDQDFKWVSTKRLTQPPKDTSMDGWKRLTK